MASQRKNPFTLDSIVRARIESAMHDLSIGSLKPRTIGWLQDVVEKLLTGHDARLIFGQSLKPGPNTRWKGNESDLVAKVHEKMERGLSRVKATEEVAKQLGYSPKSIERAVSAFKKRAA